MLLSFHFVLLPQVLVAGVISNENKTKQIKLKTSSGNSSAVWEVLPAGFQGPLCEPLSGTYLGDVSPTRGLLAFARPKTQFLWA